MVKFTLSRKVRLLTSSSFSFVFHGSKQISTSGITVLSKQNLVGYSRIGLAVFRKNIKYAYQRNRIKRLIRESFRLHQYKLSSMDFIVITKKEAINLSNYFFLEKMEKLWSYHCLLFQKL